MPWEALASGRVGGVLSTDPAGAALLAERVRRLVVEGLALAHAQGAPYLLVELRALADGAEGPTG